jgi:hypothetical protein
MSTLGHPVLAVRAQVNGDPEDVRSEDSWAISGPNVATVFPAHDRLFFGGWQLGGRVRPPEKAPAVMEQPKGGGHTCLSS